MNDEHIKSMMESFVKANPQQAENVKVHGFIYVRTFDPTTDETREERLVPNLLMTKGFNKYLQAVFNAETVSKGTFLAIGTAATGLAASGTALEAEVDRKGGTYSHTVDTAQGTVVNTFSTGGPWTIVEMGLFDALTVGTMLCRGTFAAVNKGTADSFEGKYIHSLS